MADEKLTALTALGSLSTDDLFYVVDDPGGTPASKKLAVSVIDARYLLEANNLSDLVNAGTARTNLGVAIGSNVQAYDAQLDDLAGLAVTKGNVIIADGSNWLALGIGSNDDVLTADSGEASGVKWAAPAGGGSNWSVASNVMQPAVDGDGVLIDVPTASREALVLQTTDDDATKNLAEWKNSGGTVIGYITAAGKIMSRATTNPALIANYQTLSSAVCLVAGSGLNSFLFTDNKGFSIQARTHAQVVVGSADGAKSVFRIKSVGGAEYWCGIGATDFTPGAQLEVRGRDAVRNAITEVAWFDHRTGSSGLVGFGTGVVWKGKSSTSGGVDMARISSVWTTATHASRTADIVFETVVSAAALAEAFRIISDGAIGLQADITTDVAPNDDTTIKRLSLQKLAGAPTNAAYVAFSNNPGTDTFYLVLEEG